MPGISPNTCKWTIALSSAPASPCASICALDADDVCVGCFRTGMEISYWGRLSADRQREVLSRCQRRMSGEVVPCLLDKGLLDESPLNESILDESRLGEPTG